VRHNGWMTDAPSPLLQVRNLAVRFKTESGHVDAVTGFDLDIAQGETVAIVGESGSGKSTSAMAIIGLLPSTASLGEGSSIRFDGRELVGAKESELRRIRGGSIGLVPQDPMSNLNPVSKIGLAGRRDAPRARHGDAARRGPQGGRGAGGRRHPEPGRTGEAVSA
jgi:peptide/nickel transport system ATP-binding protein